jgi:hypothetical protein
MKTIKFRAWVDNEFMLEWEDILRAKPTFPMHLLEDKDYKWMQFTGLLDKNGKEIYEGDIIDILKERLEVVWNDAYLQFQFVNKERMYELPDFNKKDLEVIGNIYEDVKEK